MTELKSAPRDVRRSDVPLIIPTLLIAAGGVSILSTDLYAPSLPHLPAFFATDAETVQLTMSLNVAAFALALLVHGPLADRFGRRPVLLLGLIAFAATSLAAAVATTVGELILARVVMGLAASVEAVVALAIIRDLYDEAGAVRVLAAYGMAIAVAPAVGPVVGGYVHVLFGWRANFLLLTGLILVVVSLSWRFLPETAPAKDRTALRPERLLSGYLRLALTRRFMGGAFASGATYGGLFAFITAGPFVLIDRLGVATQHYGLLYAILVGAYFLGSLAANRAAQLMRITGLLRLGLAITTVGGIALPLVVAVAEAPWTITTAMSVFTFGLGLIFASAPVVALEASEHGAGLTAAMLSAIEMGCGAVGALAVGVL
ncbi:MAG: multidrug effflux MFS transporter, partial [Alphaproteobacteria bacterium]